MQIEETSEIRKSEEKSPRNIGGWLILLALGVGFSPLRIIFYLSTTYPPIFNDGTWEALTTETSAAYSPFFRSVLFCELVSNLAMLAATLYLAILFLRKKSNFPKWYAGTAVFSAISVFINAYIWTLIVPDVPMFDAETAKEFARSLVNCLIWTPYLFLSQRSKETFIR